MSNDFENTPPATPDQISSLEPENLEEIIDLGSGAGASWPPAEVADINRNESAETLELEVNQALWAMGNQASWVDETGEVVTEEYDSETIENLQMKADFVSVAEQSNLDRSEVAEIVSEMESAWRESRTGDGTFITGSMADQSHAMIERDYGSRASEVLEATCRFIGDLDQQYGGRISAYLEDPKLGRLGDRPRIVALAIQAARRKGYFK